MAIWISGIEIKWKHVWLNDIIKNQVHMFVGLFLLRFVYNQISELTRRKRKWALECVQSISRLLFIDISHLFIWSKFLVNIGWNIQRKVLLVCSLTCYLVLLALVYQVKNLPKYLFVPLYCSIYTRRYWIRTFYIGLSKTQFWYP